MSKEKNELATTSEEIRRQIIDGLSIRELAGYLTPKVRQSIQPVFLLNPVPKMQPECVYDAALTQNLWYDLFALHNLDSVQKYVRVYGIAILQDTANETFEVEITDDAGVTVCSFTLVAGTGYGVGLTEDADDTDVRYGIFAGCNRYRSQLLESRVFGLRFRKTSAAGANNTAIKLVWAKWLA
mgnify:CR=1 FL=1